MSIEPIPNLSLIVCTDNNGAIGINNELPAHIPSDLVRFKRITDGHICVMGRKTFSSIITMNGKPLPNRETVVLTRQGGLPIPMSGKVRVLSNIDTLLAYVKFVQQDSKQVFVCGGESIYKALLPYVSHVYLTQVNTEYGEADTFFPIDHITKDNGYIIERLEKTIDNNSGYELYFKTFRQHDRKEL